jgi:hypothetical protein
MHFWRTASRPLAAEYAGGAGAHGLRIDFISASVGHLNRAAVTPRSGVAHSRLVPYSGSARSPRGRINSSHPAIDSSLPGDQSRFHGR